MENQVEAEAQKNATTSLSAHYLYLIAGIPIVAFLITAAPAMQEKGLRVPLGAIASGATGLLLQAIAFVLIGVLISAAVETWVSADFIERHFPHSLPAGFAVALVAGVCMPVCDCVVVPTFARLVRKGLPLPCAVTFLCAVPVVNPVAVWSTWFAFSDSLWMVPARLLMGMVIALIAGLSFAVAPFSGPAMRSQAPARPEGSTIPNGLHGMRSHHEPHPVVSRDGSTAIQQIGRYLRHVQEDFLQVMPYILFGIIVASTIRTLLGSDPSSALGAPGALLAIPVMMLVAYASSMCSSSDAVIARSLAASFQAPAILSFLVFGPMLDIKNTLMLMAECRPRFVIRLAATIIIACLLAAGAAQWIAGL